MRVAVIGTVGVPASYGGFETLVENLVHDDRVKFTVYCSRPKMSERLREYNRARLVYIPLSANGMSSIPYDVLSMVHALLTGHKIFLVLGVSGAIFLPILKLFPKVKIITNIDGIEWRRDKWKGFAKVFLKVSEQLAVIFSSHVVSDNDAITKYIFEKYKRHCNTIAYGGDHALRSSATEKLDAGFDVEEPFALSICRVEPENNVHLILEAFSKIKLPLVFIGNWDKSDYGRRLFSKYNTIFNINLLSPIYHLDTLYSYRASCTVYIHGHSAGGTNPSLVEMMHFSKPILAYDCSFNRASMADKGNYFANADDLNRMLENLSLLHDGADLADIARRRYTWDIVRQQYIRLFYL